MTQMFSAERAAALCNKCSNLAKTCRSGSDPASISAGRRAWPLLRGAASAVLRRVRGRSTKRLMRALLDSFVSHDKDDVLACQVFGRRRCHRQLISHDLELALLSVAGPRLVP